MSEKIIDAKFLQTLEKLQIFSKKIIRGSFKGDRKSAKRGRSVEFADYRDYVPGDEIKIIDWNIYGRLDRLFVKLYAEEEELSLYLLLDRSLSMEFGSPKKIDIAKKVCASLAYIALCNYDRVSLGIIDTALSFFQEPVRGKKQIFKVFDLLEKTKPSGETSLVKSLRAFASMKTRPGFTIIISDFLTPEDFFDSLKFLMFQKHELFLIQTLDPFEINPDLGGDLKLQDYETGVFKEVTVTDQLLDTYKHTITAYCEEIRSFARRVGAGYILAPTSIPFEDLVMEYLRKGRLIA